MFAFATGLFRCVTTQGDLWRPWTGYAIGALLASHAWKLVGRRLGSQVPFLEKRLALGGTASMLFGAVFFARFEGKGGGGSHQALMWTGTAFLGCGVIFFQTNFEVREKRLGDKVQVVRMKKGKN